MYSTVMRKCFEAKDPAGLGIARFCFGLLMIIDIFDERGLTLTPVRWGDPEACYFPLFNNLPRLSIEYMYLVYLILLMSATGIMLGFFYRISCFSFMVSYWYLFFLDKTVWNNHSYLYGLLSILLLFTNAHYYWSIDGLIWSSIRNKKVAFWNYGIFRFQVFLLYFFAGLKKMDRDWVSGYSMTGLAKNWMFDPFRLFLSDEMISRLIVHYGGLFFDLTQGFFLLCERTRIVAFILGYGFHGMNAVMFSIGMFSYMCMAMMTIFCRPEWPKRVVRKLPKLIQLFCPSSSESQENSTCSTDAIDKKVVSDDDHNANISLTWFQSFRRMVTVMVVFSYIIVQLILPYSHGITKGYNSWTNGLYGYSWDMMVHSWDTQHVVVKVVDRITNKTQYLRPGAFFPQANYRDRIFSHPDMLKQYALCLAERIKSMEELEIGEPQVFFDVWKSLNKRYQQRMMDPRVDIVTAPWSPFEDTPWLRPLLVELSPWRTTLTQIRSVNTKMNNATDIVFVADFPGLFLENYIAPEIIANVTVLSGNIVVHMDEKNVSVAANETLSLRNDFTHIIYTVSEKPSCYMYVYYNTTWVEKSEEELIKTDPVLQKKVNAREEWNKKTTLEKLQTFLKKKFTNYQEGVWQLYFALSYIFDIGHGENEGVTGEPGINDEL